MLHRKADLGHNDAYTDRKRLVPLGLGDEHAYKPHHGPVNSQAVADVLGLGGSPLTDHEDWMFHVRAGELYNRRVAGMNMRRYFTLAEQDVLGHEQAYAEGLGQLDYVVPGDEPDDDLDLAAYRTVFELVKAADKAKQVARAYLLSCILTATERASHDVKRR